MSVSPSVSVSDIEPGTIRLAMLNNFCAGVLDMLIYANTVSAKKCFETTEIPTALKSEMSTDQINRR